MTPTLFYTADISAARYRGKVHDLSDPHSIITHNSYNIYNKIIL